MRRPTSSTTRLSPCWLAGAHGLVEINGCLRPDAADAALQAACGRAGCAEQSVVQDTLDACTQETVTQQLAAALAAIERRQSRALVMH
jgi:hypothetical protein